MKSMKLMVLSVIGAAAYSMLSMSATAQDTPAAVMVTAAAAQEAAFTATTRCRICHGPEGHSISPIYPALAGQKAWYIVEQLQMFKAQTRRDPYARSMMWGMAAPLDDMQQAALADYFSRQSPFASLPAPFSGAENAAAITRGRTVYNDGVPANGVAPCAACHQADASGSDQFPRLAGQHASYLLKQLRAFHSGARDQIVMNGIAGPLQEADMKAVAAYLESLH
jgi:cytochrome c553